MFWFFKISRKHFSQSEKTLRLFYRNLPLRGTASLVLAIATTASPSRNDRLDKTASPFALLRYASQETTLRFARVATLVLLDCFEPLALAMTNYAVITSEQSERGNLTSKEYNFTNSQGD